MRYTKTIQTLSYTLKLYIFMALHFLYLLTGKWNTDQLFTSHLITTNNFKGIDKILQKYNSSGFTITIIHSENEFKPFMHKVKYDFGSQYELH